MRQGDRVLVLGLDGMEISYAEKLMAGGDLPNLQTLRARSAAFLLENPPAARTGLEWEQFASAMPPEVSGRASMIAVDPEGYRVWQEGARFEPFFERLDAKTVVFDSPYVDLGRAPRLRGVVGWGSHDPGAASASRPKTLVGAIGAYPSPEAIYNIPWASAARCRSMGRDLVAGLEARGKAAVRLMTELTPDWDVFFVVSGELHSATEALWHGIDPDHPLHHHPSADAARSALDDAHRALDHFVGEVLAAAGEDVHVVTFNMGGMGPNDSDVPSMVLLPELLHRRAYGTPLLEARPEWTAAPTGLAILGPDESWATALGALYPQSPFRAQGSRMARYLPAGVRRGLRRVQQRLAPRPEAEPGHLSLSWMPATRYADRWAGMDAFALPSYYQGRVRVNLEGRERDGRVPLARLDEVLDDVEGMLRECRDPRTGEAVVAAVERPSPADPLAVPSDHADLVVLWRGLFTAVEHPELGLVGPVPFRRTGGHTGTHGFCFVAGPGIEPSEFVTRSAFDVAPTVAALAGGHGEYGTPLIEPLTPVG